MSRDIKLEQQLASRVVASLNKTGLHIAQITGLSNNPLARLMGFYWITMDVDQPLWAKPLATEMLFDEKELFVTIADALQLADMADLLS